MIDVIIPAYRGLEATRRCIESVLAASCEWPSEVIVIDDASPEPALAAWLRERAATGAFTLRAHQANRGFVGTVNEGMGLHPDRDVVLLNSDTEVAPGWLDRLLAHARRDSTIGTLSPFSTNATICSYPRTNENNALPPGETTASLDAAFAAANAGESRDIPTAVGFCMAITRACLDRVGPFDEERYGAGYGEEVDFCMRAARAGYRNVIAGDVFVRHLGEVSFGGSGADRRSRAQALVDSLYPEFQPRLREFLRADPPRLLRRRADLERLRRSPRPPVIVASQAHIDAAGETLLLQPAAPAHLELRWARPGEEMALWFHAVDDWPALLALLRAVGALPGGPRSDPLPALDPRWLSPPPPSPAASSDAEVSAARDRIRALERSTSWRVTAPLRALAQAARRLLPRR